MAWGSAWRGRSYDLGRMTLRELAVAYFTCPAIQLYMGLAVVMTALSVWFFQGVGGIVLSLLTVFLLYPIAWYLIHRFILHGRWLYRMPWTSALWKRIHFDHHQDPHKLEVLFGAPSNTLPTIAGITLPVGYLIGGFGAAFAAFAAGLVITCIYEFSHCIQHLDYQPSNALQRRIKQLHLAHHFHNEGGNYGIMSFLPDRLLGTFYAQVKDVPRSPHVFNLGYDVEEAKRYPWVMQFTGSPPRNRPPGPPQDRLREEDGLQAAS